MLVALTVRRLKPGKLEDFRQAWKMESMPPGWKGAYTARNVNDENEVASFGAVVTTNARHVEGSSATSEAVAIASGDRSYAS